MTIACIACCAFGAPATIVCNASAPPAFSALVSVGVSFLSLATPASVSFKNVFSPEIPPETNAASSFPVVIAVVSADPTAFPMARLFVAVATCWLMTLESLAVPPMSAALPGSVSVASPVNPPCMAPPTMSANFPEIAPPVMPSTSFPASVVYPPGVNVPLGFTKLAVYAIPAETPAAPMILSTSLPFLIFPANA